MNNLIALLTAIQTRLALILSASILATTLFSISTYADELKDISEMIDRGQSAAAIDKLNTYIADNPKKAQALFLKGVLLAEEGRRDDAIQVFSDVTEQFPSLPEPYNNLAVLYADQGEFNKAKKALETAIKIHPSYATAHENLGDIYARMAAESYDQALQLNSGNGRIQTKLSLTKSVIGTVNKRTMEPTKNVRMPVLDTRK